MNPAATTPAAASRHPLVQRLIEELGYPEVGPDTLHSPTGNTEAVRVLFFAGDATRHPETADVAVVLPELTAHFAGRLRPAVVAARHERALAERFGVTLWPTLVFLRGDAYLGAIARMQDWQVYLQRIEALLAAEPTRPPGVGVPVVGAPGDAS